MILSFNSNGGGGTLGAGSVGLVVRCGMNDFFSCIR